MFHRSIRAASFLVVLLSAFLPVHSAQGQSHHRLVTRDVDDNKTVELKGNTRPEATAANDLGPVRDAQPMEHMLLQLRRSPEQEQALAVLMDQLHTSGSPNYHNWLTAEEFGKEFGVSDPDIASIEGWLELHGLRVNQVYPNHMVIDFSGTAGQVREAFKTQIHSLDVKGEHHLANMTNPRIPEALASAVVGVVSLHDFKPHMMHKAVSPAHVDPQTGALISPEPVSEFHSKHSYTYGGGTHALVPEDLATIYNLTKLFQANYSGQGQTVVVIEDTDVFSTGDWTTFRSTFGLSGYTQGSFTQVHPGGCTPPGVVAGNESEAELDAEWASAAAPSAAIVLASCQDTATFGGLIALQNLLSGGNPPSIISISYGECETINGATNNASYNSAYQQAAAMGVSVFVSSGDEGAASCDANQTHAVYGITVSGFASTPYNVAVGGTDYGDTYAGTSSTYWNSSNDANYGSAKSYINEIPWNDSCASQLLTTYIAGAGAVPYGSTGFCNTTTAANDGLITTASGSGGPSGCATGTAATFGVVSGSCVGYARPSWQTGVVGLPGTNSVRVIPDVSLFAANGVWGHYYVYCDSDVADGGAVCTGAPSTWSGAGGTSFSAPILAGIQALVNQKTGSAQGNPNYVYYKLAANEYGASGTTTCNSSLGHGVASNCIFYDVTQGDMDVDCTGTNNCYRPSGTYGILSTSNTAAQPAFGTGTGWDYATGIGSVNAFNLVNSWNSAAASLPTTTALVANPASIQQSASTTLTATVIGTHLIAPKGNVSFYIGSSSGTLLGTANLATVTPPNSSAQLVVQGSALAVGSNSLVAVYNGDTADDAPSTSVAATVTVQGAQPQTISFSAPASEIYGVAPITLTATASSTLPVTLTLTSGPASLVGNMLTFTGAGSVVVTATQPGGTVGSTTYAAATPVVQTIVVNKATLTVTATNQNIPYGSAIPVLTYMITGFVNGDGAGVVSGAPAMATTATSSSPNGAYPITASLGTLSAANYSFAFVSGTLTIQAPNVLNFGTVNVGSSSSVLSYSYTFGASTTVTSVAILTNGGPGLDFADGGSTTCAAGSYTSGQSCIVSVKLKPSAPGVRAGSLVLYGSANVPIASLPLAGIGSGPQMSFGFAPSSSVAAAGLNGPCDVAVDGAGNVFIADTVNDRVVEILKAGGTVVLGSGLVYPVGVALDGAGNLYIADTNFQLSKIPNENGTLNSAHQVGINAGIGAFYATLLRVDSFGNLYIADTGSAQVIKVPSIGGVLTPAAKTYLGTGLIDPSGVAIDAAGNLFIADVGGNQLVKLTPTGTQTVIPVTAGSLALEAPSAVAVDPAGNLFIADTNNNRVVEVAANGTQSVLNVNGGLSGPGGLVEDSHGMLYLADFGHNQVATLANLTAPSLNFGSATKVGSTSSPQSVTANNTGNAPLTFSSLTLTSGFVSASVGGDCSTGSPLATGASCNVGIAFAPLASGLQGGTDTLTDNNLNVGGSTQTISLTGTAQP